MTIQAAGSGFSTLQVRQTMLRIGAALLFCCAPALWAQTSLPTPPAAPAVSKLPASTATRTSKPAWKDLAPAQQQALKPLAAHWETMSADRKRKWLEVSKNYPSLSEAEQAKLHSRMREWMLLGQQQRNQARLNFAETKKLTPEAKAAQWEAYQALSPEEKRRLAAKAPAKPAGVAVVKPVTPQKLTVIPVTRHTPKEEAPATAARAIDRNTLLPQPVPAEPAPAAEPTPAPEDNS